MHPPPGMMLQGMLTFISPFVQAMTIARVSFIKNIVSIVMIGFTVVEHTHMIEKLNLT